MFTFFLRPLFDFEKKIFFIFFSRFPTHLLGFRVYDFKTG